MRLGVSYNVFNGQEHLAASVRSIRDVVEHISIVWQRTSNAGEQIADEALDVLADLRRDRLVDRFIAYEPDLVQPRHANELAKRRIGMRAARWAFCSHFFTMDADEFYRAAEVKRARRIIADEGLTSTSCGSWMHVRRPVYRARDTCNVAFITRLGWRTRLGVAQYPAPEVDPTRKLRARPERHRHFGPDVVSMFHMNLVRRDIGQKLRNSSTTDRTFLDRVGQEVADWTPCRPFDFGPKGLFDFEVVPNEFGTYDPGS